MDTIFLPPMEDPVDNPPPIDGIQVSIYGYTHEFNVTDGGEFLDDAIRMIDQPLGGTSTVLLIN